MAHLQAYLNYNGNCFEAFSFYKEVFGTEFTNVMRYGDMEGDQVPDHAKDQIMNIGLPINEDTFILGSDIVDGFNPFPLKQGNNTYLLLDCTSADEARNLYGKLSGNAQLIEMELGEQFWAELYGSFIDQFGIAWMINFDGVKKMF